MRREEILTAGNYISIPKPIMQRRDVSPAAKLVLASLVDHLGPINETTWPGPATIAEETGLTRRGVQKCLEQLATHGIIRRHGQSERGTNTYSVGSEQSTLANSVSSEQSSKGSEQSSKGSEQSSKGSEQSSKGSEQSTPELLNRTTEATTEGNDRRFPAAPGGATPDAPLPDQSGSDSLPQSNSKPEGITSSAITNENPKGDSVPAIEGLNPLVSQGAVGQPAPKKVKTAGAKPKRPTLSDEDKAKICSSAEIMRLWLCGGMAAVNAGSMDGLPHSELSFRRYVTREDDKVNPHIELWTPQTFAGWYWARVTAWNEENKLPITLPNVGRLIAAFSDLLKRYTRQDVYHRVNEMIRLWLVVQHRCRGLAGIQFNETVLQHSAVANVLSELLTMGENQLQDAINEAYTARAA